MISETNFEQIIRDILRVLRTEILRKSYNPHNPSQSVGISDRDSGGDPRARLLSFIFFILNGGGDPLTRIMEPQAGGADPATLASNLLEEIVAFGRLPLQRKDSGGRKSINVTQPRWHPGPRRRVTPPCSARK